MILTILFFDITLCGRYKGFFLDGKNLSASDKSDSFEKYGEVIQ